MALWGRRAFYGAEAGLGVRPAGQMRLAFTAASGARDGRPAGRLSAEAQFLVLPGARGGLSPYLGLGVAALVVNARHGSGALTLTAGLESGEGKRVGWYVEGGTAGGARLAIGVRWRRFPPWWR